MIAFETDIHAVAGLLKRYFRELPDPLFTEELYVNFVQALGKHAASSTAWCLFFHTHSCRNLLPCIQLRFTSYKSSVAKHLFCVPFWFQASYSQSVLFVFQFHTLGLSDPEARDQCLLSLLYSLPLVNFKTAVFLFKHLRRWVAYNNYKMRDCDYGAGVVPNLWCL